MSLSIFFHSYEDITINSERMHLLTYARMPHLLWQMTSISNGHLLGSVTLTTIAELFRSRAVGTLNLPLADQSFNPLRHHRCNCSWTAVYTSFVYWCFLSNYLSHFRTLHPLVFCISFDVIFNTITNPFPSSNPSSSDWLSVCRFICFE